MKRFFYFLIAAFVLAKCLGVAGCGTPPLEKLAAPDGFALSENTVTWGEIENAVGYAVAFQNKESETAEPCFALPDGLEEGDYTIEVLAIGDYATYADSEWASFSFTREEPPAQDDDESGLLYTLLPDGSGYEVGRGEVDLKGKVTIPAYFKGLPVKKIADEAFMYHVGQQNPNPHTGAYCNIVTTAIELPDTLTEIGEAAFACISKLEEVTIPETVTKIGSRAFWGCTALKQVTLPKNLKVIPEACFQDCALSEISFPDGLEEIGESAFESEYYSIGNIKRSDQSFTEIELPNSVKRIRSGAFSGCLKLKDVTLPDELEYMGASVFSETAWLDSQPEGIITLGNVLYEYKGDMEEGTKITIPSHVKYIAGRAFYQLKNLAEVAVSDGVKLIGEGIFGSCSSLTHIKLPSDLTAIPNGTFTACKSLVHIDIPSGVTEIGERAFRNCSALEEIILPDGLISITGVNVFAGCASLKEIVLPASLKNLGLRPFENCGALSKIYYEGTEEAWNALKAQNNVVDILPNGRQIPVTMEQAFSNATIYYLCENVPQNAGNYWRYVDGKPTVWEMI